MTHVGPAPAAPTVVATPTVRASYLEWGPIVAGALLAAALSFVLLTFGAAIGLSATSPWPNSGVSAKFIAGVAVFWTLVQQIGAFMAGGYIAGRMRTRWNDSAQDEVEFRDGLHGALVWAVGIVIGAALLMATVGAVTRTGAQVAGQAAVTLAGSNVNPMDTVMDTLLRPATPPRITGSAPRGSRTETGRARWPNSPRSSASRRTRATARARANSLLRSTRSLRGRRRLRKNGPGR